MNEILLINDLAVLNNVLVHYGMKGQKKGVFGASGATRYQNHAVYAKGAKRYENDRKNSKKLEKEKSKARSDAIYDYSIDAGVRPWQVSKYGDKYYKPDLLTETRYSQRRAEELSKNTFNLQAEIAKRKHGGQVVSKEYYDEYMDVYTKAVEAMKDKLLRPAKENTSTFVVDGKKKQVTMDKGSV